MTLPVHVPFYDDETPLSFASRLAAANGYRSVKAMLSLMGLTWQMAWRADSRALDVLGHWSGESMERRLRYFGPMNPADKTKAFGQATLMPLSQRPVSNVRCCPACIAEDLSRSGREIARPYIRAWWLIAEIENCPVHKRPLVVLPAAEEGDGEDLARRIHKHLPKLQEEASTEMVVGTEFDEFILSCFNGEPTSSFLGEIQTHIAIGFCIRLGSDLLAAERRSDASAGEFGYAVARQGSDAIAEAMRSAYRTKQDSQRFRFWSDHFPALGGWITLKVDRPQYEPVVTVVREAAAWCMPIGPSNFILGGVTRRLHSLSSARKNFPLSPDRIRAIMKKAGILEDVRAGRSKAVFDAAAGEKLLNAALASAEAAETARLLGTTGNQLRRLCKSGLLTNVAEKLNYERKRYRIERAEINQLLEALQRRATHTEHAEGWSTLSNAARASSLGYAAVVRLILAGRLTNVVYVGADCNLDTVRVDLEELLGVKHSPKPESADAAPRLSRSEGRAKRFLLPLEFRTLTLADLTMMPDATADQLFKRMRWPETDGKPYCPKCGSLRCSVHKRRLNRFVCNQTTCGTDFTIISGTALHGGKLSVKKLLTGLWFSVHVPERKAALKLSREIGVQYPTARALLMKLRDAWRWQETAQEGDETAGEGAADDMRLTSSGVTPTGTLASTT